MTAKRRWRQPIPKPGILDARYGKPHFDAPDLLYTNGAGTVCADARMLSKAFEAVAVHNGNTLRQELESRGYDITTLRFSIELANKDTGQ